LSLTSILKKREPYAQNPIYQKSLHVSCPYCRNHGPRKNFKTLWRLYMHFRTHHKHENYREMVMKLADFVIDGVLL